MTLHKNSQVIVIARANLEAMIETDANALRTAIARELNEFETNAIVEKAITAICSTMTREQGRFFLKSIGARQ
jgi:hypothetical protein